MTAYIYVLGIWNFKRKEMRFEHKVVLADSEEMAYTLGSRVAAVARLFPIEGPETANDYVIKLVED